MLEVRINETKTEIITDSLYQYDIGQKMRIAWSNLTTAPKIHFANSASNTALVVSSRLEESFITANIPNTLLAEPLPIFAYVYDIENEGTVGNTIYVIKIPIKKRPRPADYEYVEDLDLIRYESLDARLTQLIAEWTGAFDDTQKSVAELITKVNSVVSGTASITMGMYNCETSFSDDGSITEIGDGWSRVITFELDGSIKEVFTTTSENGESSVITKVTTFDENGDIRSVIVD